MPHIYLALILFSALLPGNLLSQNNPLLAQYEDSLITIYKSINEETAFNRESKSLSFYKEFYDVLEKEGSFTYPFENLKNIGKVYSSDNKIRVYTWNIPIGIDENLYFGIVQYYSNTNNKYISVKLNEPTGINRKSKLKTWHGNLIYEIIGTKHAGQKYFTLLGFDLHNSLSNKKRIDVLSIDNFGELYFCEKLIFYNEKLVDNIEFEYNEKAIMSLRYNKEAKMIVFDHLSPYRASLDKDFEFYGPDFTYDGLKFEKGIWHHYKNIDITN